MTVGGASGSRNVVGMIVFHKCAMNQRRRTCLATDLAGDPRHSGAVLLEVSIYLGPSFPFRR